MTIENLKKCKYGLTHSGTFHADDVFATAFIKLINPNIKVIRASSVPVDFKGIVYDIGNGLFDHHSLDNKKRSNGIPYAAFGKLWAHFAPFIYDDYIVGKIDKKFIAPLDLSDNTGSPDTLCSAIAAMNPVDEANGDKEFAEAVKFATIILKNLIQHEIKNYEEEKEVKEIYEKSINKEIIVLNKHLHFTDYLPKTEAI